jgi:leucyl aminopeptidase
MKSTRLLAFFASISSTALFAEAVSVKPKADLGPVDQANVLFQEGDFAVVANPTAKTADFSNLYVVNTTKLKNKAMLIGKTIAQSPATFAVMRLNEEEFERVSETLDAAGNSCGALFRLMGDRMPVNKTLVDAAPVIAANQDIQALHDIVQDLSADNIKATVTELAAIFTRYHSTATGMAVAGNLAIKYQELAAGRDDVTATTFDHGSKTKQPSLVVRIQGTTKPEEIIVLGSHIDSTAGFGGNSRAPGADDNASGTATNLEVFRNIMQHNLKFARTIEIHGYAAEELGLVGSQDLAQKYKAANKNVIAMFQIDMNLYNGNKPDRIWFVTNNTNAQLNKDLQALTDRYVGTPWSAASLSGGSSDHASWNRLGYPAAFPFENPNAYNGKIHSANDTIENSGAFTQSVAFAKLATSYLAHFAGVVDQE